MIGYAYCKKQKQRTTSCKMFNGNKNLNKVELLKQLKESRKLGVKELKNYKGFEDIDEEEALNVIESLFILAEALLTINEKDYE